MGVGGGAGGVGAHGAVRVPDQTGGCSPLKLQSCWPGGVVLVVPELESVAVGVGGWGWVVYLQSVSLQGK